MKKYLLSTALMLVAIFSLTSCGDDEPKVKDTATATYNMSFSQDLLKACNVFITYKAENGRNVMDKITETWWSKTVTSDQFPAEFGVMYKFSTVPDNELTQEKYDLSCKLQFSGRTSKGSSYSNEVTIIDLSGVEASKVVNTLKKYDGKSTGFRVSKDGIYSSANNLDYE